MVPDQRSHVRAAPGRVSMPRCGDESTAVGGMIDGLRDVGGGRIWHRDRMILLSAVLTSDSGKGWYVGPWNSPVSVAVGWADRGVNEPHRHDHMNEIYLVARGHSVARVAGRVGRAWSRGHAGGRTG